VNEKIYIENPENPFLNVQDEDRRALLRILYPTIDYDLLFYPKQDNKETLDEFGLPTRVTNLYIITSDKELKQHLHDVAKSWYKSKIIEK
jgi:hypothetical protein